MTEIDPKDSVQNEQFGNSEDTNNSPGNENITSPQSEKEQKVDDESKSSDSLNEVPTQTSDAVDASPVTETVEVSNEENKQISEAGSIESAKADIPVSAEEITSESSDSKKPEESLVEAKGSDTVIQKNEDSTSKEDASKALPSLSEIDYFQLPNEKLVDTFSEYLSDFSIDKIKDHVEAIKSVFYKKLNLEIDEKKEKFLQEGGVVEDFKHEESPIELKMKDLLNTFRNKRNDFNRSIESQKETNLQTKYEIIESIKELINSQESLNKTFHDFRALQEKWRDVGSVPQKNVKDLWENYHYHVEAFYDYIKINKELRDLDFKKNLDSKLALCEKSEELIIEASVVEAFRRLQTLHDQWREIGPVPSDKRTEIWKRFKDATAQINHRHQEYFVNLKDEQKKNLEEKTVLCEKAEEIAEQEIDGAKGWELKSKEIIELQKIWKTIGFAPKKYNTKIYERFRAACDKFFDRKRNFFAKNREEQEGNLQLKTELCIQAEVLQENTDWKKTTDELIKLQKKWKSIGSVPLKQSDKIWKRFRAACDTFFNNKSKFYENIDSKYDENLKLKEDIIEEIEKFELTENIEEDLTYLKDIQRKWSEVGFVPIKQKDEIQEKYRELINLKFDKLQIDDDKKSVLKFRSRMESVASKPNADRRLSMERDKCFNKLKQLESDIILWENNIGFFSNSKNAASLINDVEEKIKSARLRIVTLKENLNIIDEFDH